MQKQIFNGNGRSPLVVELTEYRGEQRLDMRYHYHKDGELRPTKRGISLPLDLVAPVIRAARDVNGKAHELDTQARNPLLVQHTVYRGKQRVDIRRHYWKDGELRPTKRGISLPVDLVTGVLAACDQMVAGATQEERREEPSMEQLRAWMFDSVAKATDGCMVEPDGICPHGHKSWLLELGLI